MANEGFPDGVAILDGMRLVGREAGLEDGLALATAAAGRTGGLFGSLWGGSGGIVNVVPDER